MSSFLLLVKLFGQRFNDFFLLSQSFSHQCCHLGISNRLLQSKLVINVQTSILCVRKSISLLFIVSLLIQDRREPLYIIGLQHNPRNLNLPWSSRLAVASLFRVTPGLSGSILQLLHHFVILHGVVLKAVVVSESHISVKLVDVFVDLEGVCLTTAFRVELDASLGAILEHLDFRWTVLEGDALLGWLGN